MIKEKEIKQVINKNDGLQTYQAPVDVDETGNLTNLLGNRSQ